MSETTDDFGPSPASLWTLSAALREIERLREIIIEIGVTAATCRHEMREVIGDNEQRRAIRALTKIVDDCTEAMKL
jgi:hypothetical protein